MAFSFSATASTVPPQFSVRATISSGLKFNSASPFGAPRPNLSLRHGTCNGKPTHGQVQMMSFGSPLVRYNKPGQPAQWVDLWNALFQERIIFIGDHIDEYYSNHLISTMLYLDNAEEERKRITFFVNVAGGDVTPTLSIYDTMQYMNCPLGTFLIGYAESLMGFIIASGQKGHRRASPMARIGLKSPANYTSGQADDVLNETKELLRINDYLCKQLSEKTGQPLEKVSGDFKASQTLYFNSQQALEYGIIDEILEPRNKFANVRRRRRKPGQPRKLGPMRKPRDPPKEETLGLW